MRGKNAQRDKSTVLRADYALFYKPNIPLAVIEAKDNQHAMGAGACPSPTELWDKYCACKGWTPAVRQVAALDYSASKTPRYYQLNAINRSVEAIATGQNRVLLVMATSTGKTYTAFQIIWRLCKSKAK